MLNLNLFRRRVPVPDPLPLMLRGGLPEANIAVGSLSGIAPADIQGHLLIVVGTDGRASLTGNACPELAAMVLTQMAAELARTAYKSHECGGEDGDGG